MILEVLVRLYIQLKSRFLGQFVDGEPSGSENPPSAGFRGDSFGRVAQLVEHLIENQGVTSSSLVPATNPSSEDLGPALTSLLSRNPANRQSIEPRI